MIFTFTIIILAVEESASCMLADVWKENSPSGMLDCLVCSFLFFFDYIS